MGNLKSYKQSMYNFLKQFAQPYDSMQVPINNQGLSSNENAQFPYLTYNMTIEDWDEDGVVQIMIYDRADSSSRVYDIASKLEENIGQMKMHDNLVIRKGSPFAQEMAQDDIEIKCLFVNLQVNYY